MKILQYLFLLAPLVVMSQVYAEEASQTETPTSGSSAEATTTSEGYGKPEGVLGKLTFGPQLTLVGLPTLFRGGLEAKYDNLFGAGLEYGFVPTVTLNTIAMSLNNFQGSVKIYPFKGALHIGVAVGSRTFTGNIPVTVAGTAGTLTGTASTTYLAPTLGWKWVYSGGFFFGLDFGWQFTMSSSSTLTSSPAALATTASGTTEFTQMNDALTTIGRASLPTFTLLQIGYLF